jgi:ribonucleoside-diphosphate reductase beta chain
MSDSALQHAASSLADSEPAGPLQLFHRWERQQWVASAYDLGAEAEAWVKLRPFTREELRARIGQFFLGEAAVTETLGPLAHAAPTPEAQLFLCTQLADEARHTVFFLRYVQAVDRRQEELGELLAELWSGASDGQIQLFQRELADATERVRESPADRDAWYAAIAIYHLLVEAVLAIAGQKSLLAAARELSTLPLLEEGILHVARDESRHISFGTHALRQGVRAGHADAILGALQASIPSVVDVLIDPARRSPSFFLRPLLVARANQLEAAWESALRALLKRVRTIGLEDRAAEIEQRWLAAREAALDRYEALHLVPHPVRAARAGSRPRGRADLVTQVPVEESA